MKKAVVFIFVLLLLVACSSHRKDYSYLYTKESKYDISKDVVSPYIGRWNWVYYNLSKGECITMDIGERNDSLMITLSYTLNQARFVESGNVDRDGKQIPDICIAAPKSGNTIKGVFCPEESRIKSEPPFGSFLLRLIDKNTLVMEVSKGYATSYTPKQTAFKRKDSKNREFSHRLDYVYIDTTVVK